jgi:hypothetical protein
MGAAVGAIANAFFDATGCARSRIRDCHVGGDLRGQEVPVKTVS